MLYLYTNRDFAARWGQHIIMVYFIFKVISNVEHLKLPPPPYFFSDPTRPYPNLFPIPAG